MSDQLKREVEHMRRRLDEHDQRFDRGEDQFRLILQGLKDNTAAVTKLADETTEVREVWRDIKGTVRVGSGVQRFIVWSIAVGGVLSVLGFCLNWLIEHFTGSPPVPPPGN